MSLSLILVAASLLTYQVQSYVTMSTLDQVPVVRSRLPSFSTVYTGPVSNADSNPAKIQSRPKQVKAPAVDASTSTTKTPSRFLQSLSNLLESESVGTLLPKEDMIAMVNEIRFNQVIMSKAYPRFEVVWKYFRTLVYEEDRNLQSILGKEISAKALEVAGKLDFYEKKTVRSFIKTQAFSSIFGGFVYETLFEVLQKFDIIGRTVNRVPVVGGIRRRVSRGIRSTVDRTVGARFKNVLLKNLSMNNLADFMLAQRDNKQLEDANRGIMEAILTRPLKTFFPNAEDSDEKLKRAIWSIVTDTPTSEFMPIMNFLYDNLGSARLSDIIALSFDPDLAAKSTSFAEDGAKTVFSSKVRGSTVNVIIKL